MLCESISKDFSIIERTKTQFLHGATDCYSFTRLAQEDFELD